MAETTFDHSLTWIWKKGRAERGGAAERKGEKEEGKVRLPCLACLPASFLPGVS